MLTGGGAGVITLLFGRFSARPAADHSPAERERRRVSEHRPRGAERRQQERRQLGVTATRTADAERNAALRPTLHTFLRTLPPDELWYWFDGLLLCRATDAQLELLWQLAQRRRADAQRLRGRPRAAQFLPTVTAQRTAAFLAAWRSLGQQLKGFATFRQR
jgi:hypothetical protein